MSKIEEDDDAIQQSLLDSSIRIKDEKQSNILSQLFFCWVFPTIRIANRTTLEAHMIKDLAPNRQSQEIYRQFKIIFDRNKQSSWALAKTLLTTFKGTLIFCSFFITLQMSLQMCTPILIHEVIIYISDEHKEFKKGMILVSLIFGARFLYAIIYSHTYLKIRVVGYDAVSAISMALLAKCMKVSFMSNKKHKSGEVINLMQVDTTRLQFVTFYLVGVVFMPFQIMVALYLMFYYIGISFLAGCGVILVTSILNFFIGKLTWRLQKELMKAKDSRTKSANELFSSIKFVKVNAFENYFIDKLFAFREKEMSVLRKRFTVGCINVLLLWTSPMLIINATFAMYVLLDNVLSPEITFTLIGLFQILQEPLRSLPQSINNVIEANVSIRRMEKFLLTDELMLDCIEHEHDEELAVEVKNGEFFWLKKEEKAPHNIADSIQYKAINDSKASETLILQSTIGASEEVMVPILKGINLQVLKGSFVSIVGDVGSGKSSLVQALVGEMIYQGGSVKPSIQIDGNIAYVSQKTWIQNATVKENILFGKPFDQRRYNEAIEYSCLTSDIEILIKGDQTMIGEKGVNLSGGQKARVSLARAIYSDSDIYLLDDPISAVDVHVGKFIMHKCLNGILKHKTRILVTHALNYCQYTDYVYLMDDGSIVEEGPYDKIKTSEIFQRIYQNFYTNQQKEQNDDEDDLDEQDKTDEGGTTYAKKSQQSKQNSLGKKSSSKKELNEILPPIETARDEIDDLMLLEDRQKGGIQSETLIAYFKMNGGFLFFSFISIITILQVGSQIGANLWLAYWTQQSQESDVELTKDDNIYYLYIYSSFSLTFGVFAFVRSYLLAWSSTRFADRIHKKMVNCLAYAPQCQFFERVPLGRILNRMTKDQSVLDLDIYWGIAWLYIQIFTLFGNVFLNVYASTYYIMIPVVGFFCFAWFMQRIYMKAQRELYRIEGITKSPILSYFSETVNGLTTVRAFNKTDYFMEIHAKNLNLNRKIQLQQLYTNTWFQLVLTFCSYSVNISAIVFCIFYSSKNPAFAGLLMTYASSINDNIQYTIQAIGFVETQIISFERCLAYTHVKPEKAYEALVESKQKNDRTYSEKDRYISDWPTKGKIEFQNYSVQYRENLPPALKNLTLTIEPKAKIGVVGRTGAGKSTITLTLLRILEAMEGSILIDGVDISTLSLQQLRESITMIMQDATLFDGTLRQNIDPLNLHTDEQLLEIVEKCRLGTILQREGGLQTHIAEGGENLSAGEKQLVCIARAVQKKSRVVLIDEATANIDIETEQKIQETIQEGFAECTVITIAHRINTILHCDKILVVDKGFVKEFGNTKDLLDDRESIFYGIYQEALKEQNK